MDVDTLEHVNYVRSGSCIGKPLNTTVKVILPGSGATPVLEYRRIVQGQDVNENQQKQGEQSFLQKYVGLFCG